MNERQSRRATREAKRLNLRTMPDAEIGGDRGTMVRELGGVSELETRAANRLQQSEYLSPDADRGIVFKRSELPEGAVSPVDVAEMMRRRREMKEPVDDVTEDEIMAQLGEGDSDPEAEVEGALREKVERLRGAMEEAETLEQWATIARMYDALIMELDHPALAKKVRADDRRQQMNQTESDRMNRQSEERTELWNHRERKREMERERRSKMSPSLLGKHQE